MDSVNASKSLIYLYTPVRYTVYQLDILTTTVYVTLQLLYHV